MRSARDVRAMTCTHARDLRTASMPIKTF